MFTDTHALNFSQSNDNAVRVQIVAALKYINRTHNEYKLDWHSCSFYARLVRRRRTI